MAGVSGLGQNRSSVAAPRVN